MLIQSRVLKIRVENYFIRDNDAHIVHTFRKTEKSIRLIIVTVDRSNHPLQTQICPLDTIFKIFSCVQSDIYVCWLVNHLTIPCPFPFAPFQAPTP